MSALLALALTGVALALAHLSPDTYYELLQEDAALEWATLWLLLAGGGGFAWRAARVRGARGLVPLGLALGCLAVAGEEISWGQRLLGFAPPQLFLERNFQQEANFHNLAPSGLRQLAVALGLGALGIALPLAFLFARVRHGAARIGLPSTLSAAPLFVAALGFQLGYPLEFSGEVAELLAAAGLASLALGELVGASERWGALAGPVALALAAALGVGSAQLAASRPAHPEQLLAAQRETEALARDLLIGARALGGAPTRCGVHLRLHTLARSKLGEPLPFAEFHAEAKRRDGEARAAALVDPWASSYWVRDHCEGETRSVFVYSFGPNRRRDSSERALAGDDVGAYLVRRAQQPRAAQPAR